VAKVSGEAGISAGHHWRHDMKIRVVIDRFEGELAVLEIAGEGVVDWPRKFLPEGSHEGAILDFDIELNPEAEAKQRKKVAALQDELLRRTAEMEN